jgi:hypothetical protein
MKNYVGIYHLCGGNCQTLTSISKSYTVCKKCSRPFDEDFDTYVIEIKKGDKQTKKRTEGLLEAFRIEEMLSSEGIEQIITLPRKKSSKYKKETKPRRPYTKRKKSVPEIDSSVDGLLANAAEFETYAEKESPSSTINEVIEEIDPTVEKRVWNLLADLSPKIVSIDEMPKERDRISLDKILDEFTPKDLIMALERSWVTIYSIEWDLSPKLLSRKELNEAIIKAYKEVEEEVKKNKETFEQTKLVTQEVLKSISNEPIEETSQIPDSAPDWFKIIIERLEKFERRFEIRCNHLYKLQERIGISLGIVDPDPVVPPKKPFKSLHC